MPREWDAVRYDALPLPHRDWARRTIERLDPAPDAVVLDAGCGTGRDAETLLARMPTGRVVAVDASPAMLDRLRERLAGQLDRVEVVRADLVRPLPAGIRVDAVLSVAAFHWVPDHAALFANLAVVTRPGGRLATDCGGFGNIARVDRAVAEVLGRSAADQPSPWHFATAEETDGHLRAAGFTDLDVRLRPAPVPFADPIQLRDYLRTVVLGGQLDRMPAGEHDAFVAAVADRLPEPVIDYVRLEITAIRG